MRISDWSSDVCSSDLVDPALGAGEIVSETIETWFDQPLLFTIAERHVRGRLVRLGPVLNSIMAAHSYPPTAEKLIAAALVLTVLLGQRLQDPASQLTSQAPTGGGPGAPRVQWTG